MDFDAKTLSQLIGLISLAAAAVVYILFRARGKDGQVCVDEREVTYQPSYHSEEVIFPTGVAGPLVAPLDPDRPVYTSVNSRTGVINWVR